MQYIVDFQNDVTQEQIDNYITENSGTLVKVWDKIQRIKLIEFPETPAESTIVEAIELNDASVMDLLGSTVCENNNHLGFDLVPGLPTHTFSTSDEKDWWKNFVMSQPEMEEESKTISRRGQNVTIYLMDSGINAGHEDLVDANISDLFTITENDFSDQRGHGTALASVMVGKTCGFTDCAVKNVKIFRESGQTLLSEFVDSLNAIMNDVNLKKWNIVNCSWSIPHNSLINQLFQDLIDFGVIVVCAAGNSGTEIGEVSPASVHDAFTIGSINSDLEPSDFSNYTGGSAISYTGEKTNFGTLNLWAPGEKIWAAQKDSGFTFNAGTSISSAITSAVFAYALCDYTDSEGEKACGYKYIPTASSATVLQMITFYGLHDLVELDDEKYANSRNQIVGLWNRTQIDQARFDFSTDVVTWSLRASQEYNIGAQVFNMYRFESIEFVDGDELPDNFAIGVHGSLVFDQIDESQKPDVANGERYKHYSARVRVKYLDEDEPQDKTINIYILADDFTEDDVPESDDFYIPVTLQNCSGPTVGACRVGMGAICSNNCGSLQCCDSIGKQNACDCA